MLCASLENASGKPESRAQAVACHKLVSPRGKKLDWVASSCDSRLMASILVLDDHDVLRATIVKALQGAGHTVLGFPDGKQALTLAGAVKLDLVLSDVFMPEKEGLETIEELRNRFPSLKIIAMSVGGAVEQSLVLDLAQKLGANATLRKPFSMEELKTLVSAVLAQG